MYRNVVKYSSDILISLGFLVRSMCCRVRMSALIGIGFLLPCVLILNLSAEANISEETIEPHPPALEQARALALYSEAFRLELSADHSAAIDKYIGALNYMPDKERIYRRLISCYVNLDRMSDCVEMFESLREQSPRNFQVHRWLGFLYHLQEARKSAVESYRAAIEINPSEVDPHTELAVLLFSGGDTEGAVDLLRSAVSQADDLGKLLDLVGRMYLNHIQSGGGRDDLSGVYLDLTHEIERRIEPEADYLLRIAYIYTAGHRIESAVAVYRRIIEEDPNYAQAYLGLAEIYLATGRPQDALTILEEGEAVTERPSEIMAMLAQVHARVAAQLVDTDEAMSHRDSAISLLERMPASVDVDNGVQRILSLIKLHVGNENYKRALRVVQSLKMHATTMPALQSFAETIILNSIRTDPARLSDKFADAALELEGDALILSLAADIMVRLGNIERAHEIFTRALDVGVLQSGGHYSRAAMLARAVGDGEYMKILQQGIELFPDSPELYDARARFLMQDSDYAAALESFSKAKELMDTDARVGPSIIFNLHYVVALQKKGQTQAALELMNNTEMLKFQVLDGYYELARQHFEDEEFKIFQHSIDQLLEDNPDSADLTAFVGYRKSQRGEYEEAAKKLKRAVQLASNKDSYESPLLAIYNFWCGAAFERSGDMVRAEKYLRASIELDENFAEAYNYLAYTWAEEDTNLSEALEFIQVALELDPDNGAFVDTLGWILYRKGQYEDSLRHLEHANNLMPNNEVILEHLGDVHLQLLNREKSLRYYGKSLRVKPDNDDVRSKYDELRNVLGLDD